MIQPNKLTDDVLRVMLMKNIDHGERNVAELVGESDHVLIRQHMQFLKEEYPDRIFLKKWGYGGVAAYVESDNRAFFEKFLSDGGYAAKENRNYQRECDAVLCFLQGKLDHVGGRQLQRNLNVPDIDLVCALSILEADGLIDVLIVADKFSLENRQYKLTPHGMKVACTDSYQKGGNTAQATRHIKIGNITNQIGGSNINVIGNSNNAGNTYSQEKNKPTLFKRIADFFTSTKAIVGAIIAAVSLLILFFSAC